MFDNTGYEDINWLLVAPDPARKSELLKNPGK